MWSSVVSSTFRQQVMTEIPARQLCVLQCLQNLELRPYKENKQRGVCMQTTAHYIYTLSEVPGVRNGGVQRLLLLFSHSRGIEVCAALISGPQESLISFCCCHSCWSSLKQSFLWIILVSKIVINFKNIPNSFSTLWQPEH